jgi:hypothetical protein
MAAEIKASSEAAAEAGRDFIRDIVKADLDAGRRKAAIVLNPGPVRL